MKELENLKIGYCMSGSFCTFDKSFETAKKLCEMGAELTPILSFNASKLSTRFGNAEDNVEEIEEICGAKAILTIEDAEPIGPKKMFDILVVCPCTANTASKLALEIIDTPVTMSVKSHLRNQRPVVIALSTNDALSACAKSTGYLINTKNYYFVPMRQDAPFKKPFSAIADFELVPQTIQKALKGEQIQPIMLGIT